MQAFEFKSTISDGVIKIPEEYIGKMEPHVKVIVLSEEKKKMNKTELFSLAELDTSGFIFDRDEANAR